GPASALPLPVAPPHAAAASADLAPFLAAATTPLSRVLKPGDLAPARPFRFAGSFDAREQAVGCLAAAAWYEAGNDPEGQRSVIQVVLNRVKHPAFPKTVCGVVLQGSERHTGCQFSFTCDGSLDRRRPRVGDWQLARFRADSALSGAVDREVAGATHYHADYVTPWWSSKLEQLVKVGRHIFYRWPGSGPLPGGRAGEQPENPTALTRLGIATDGAFTGRKPALANGPQIVAQPVALAVVAESAPVVLAPARPPGPIVMPLDPVQPSGRWAIDALRRCVGATGCKVVGYADAAVAARNASLSDSQRDLPQFVLIRDGSDGRVVAMWDCQATPRSDADQCLPRQGDAVRALLRERGPPRS
ncbi:MAG: cell wall hydrolase, partial [Proteobacteria bacterium]|nr:cell wall hydrolase [Pseudomonadota bacterium]